MRLVRNVHVTARVKPHLNLRGAAAASPRASAREVRPEKVSPPSSLLHRQILADREHQSRWWDSTSPPTITSPSAETRRDDAGDAAAPSVFWLRRRRNGALWFTADICAALKPAA
ncbi:hypothetical protein AGIG_G19019 [Arapaima gigas]